MADPWTRLRLWHRLATRSRRVAAAERAFEATLAGLGPGDIALDCGANIGEIAARIAATGVHLHAFEPDPDAFAALSQRLGDAPNAVLHNAAVGVRAGRMPLYPAAGRVRGGVEGSVSSSLLSESRRVRADPIAEVEVIDLPAFLDALPAPPALVKIDIEGAEVALLEALFDSGRIARMGRVFVESHEKQLPSLRRRIFRLIDRAAALPGRPVSLDWG